MPKSEIHASEVHACEIHAREMRARETYAREIHAHEVHACEMHAREMHAHEVQRMNRMMGEIFDLSESACGCKVLAEYACPESSRVVPNGTATTLAPKPPFVFHIVLPDKCRHCLPDPEDLLSRLKRPVEANQLRGLVALPAHTRLSNSQCMHMQAKLGWLQMVSK
jgi:hypothetical protein